jgi:hypothetical protein
MGVLFMGWDAGLILLLYWTENLIVGFYNILKMAWLKGRSIGSLFSKFFYICFFSLHFGGFCAVHGMFLMILFKVGPEDISTISDKLTWPMHLVFLQLLFRVISHLLNFLPAGMEWPILGLLVSHGISFIFDFVRPKKHQSIGLKDLMTNPYQRIIILHITIIAGAFLIKMIGSNIALLVVLILIKIIIDIKLYYKIMQKA